MRQMVSETSSRYLLKKSVSDFVELVHIVSNGDLDRVVFVKNSLVVAVCLADHD